MNKRIVFGIVALVIIVAVIYIVKVYAPLDSSHEIVMPSPTTDNGDSIGSDESNHIVVNTETVKTALSTLSRTDSFSGTYTVERYWSDGSSTSTLSCWQNGDKVKLEIEQDDTVKNILFIGDDIYIWYSSTYGVFKSKLSENNLKSEIDMFSGLITYENIMDTPQQNITDAQFINQAGQPCIYIEYQDGSDNYVNQIVVSIDTGLLISEKIYDGEELIYSIEAASPLVPSAPQEDVFKTPS